MKPDNQSPGSVELPAENSPNQLNPNAMEKAPAETPVPASTDSSQPRPEPELESTQTSSSSTAPAGGPPSAGSFEASLSTLPAEESDTIEAEWVDKAEEIADRTGSDPYSEDDAQHALSRAYLKKRFGMDIK